MKSAMTASERWVAKRLKTSEARAEVAKMRAEIDIVDQLVRALEDRRAALGLSKVELARRISGDRGSLQRLLTAGGNPTLETYVGIAKALGCTVQLVEDQPARAAKAAPTKKATKSPAAKPKSKTKRENLANA